MDPLPEDMAVIIIDHGSRRAAANDMLFDMIAQYKAVTGVEMVEGAHMELAKPTLAEAVQACAARGASRIVVHPYFLAPGRHSTGDIPRMVATMAENHPGITFHISEPLGVTPKLAEVIQQRVLEALD